MSHKEIKKLEEKYWLGETSLEEERRLKDAIRNFPDSLSKSLIDTLQIVEEQKTGMDELKLGDDFDTEFWDSVGQADPKIKTFKIKPLHFVRYAAAAIILIGFSFGIWYAINETSVEQASTPISSTQDSFNSPEEAFEEAKRALSFASSKRNRAEEEAKKINRFHQATMSVTGGSMSTAKELKDEND